MKTDIVERLYAEYYNDALIYTLSLTKSKSLAEEIAQGAFFKALKTADDSIKNFKPWLLTVCRNSFLSMQRKMKKQVALSDDLQLADEEEALIDKVIRDEEYQALYKAISLLSEVQREIITLFYFENVPIKTIGEIIGKNENNVKVLLYRARENLKQTLEER